MWFDGIPLEFYLVFVPEFGLILLEKMNSALSNSLFTKYSNAGIISALIIINVQTIAFDQFLRWNDQTELASDNVHYLLHVTEVYNDSSMAIMALDAKKGFQSP